MSKTKPSRTRIKRRSVLKGGAAPRILTGCRQVRLLVALDLGVPSAQLLDLFLFLLAQLRVVGLAAIRYTARLRALGLNILRVAVWQQQGP